MEVIAATESHVPEIVEMWKDFMDLHRDIDSFFTRRKDAHINFEKFLRGLIQSPDRILFLEKTGAPRLCTHTVCNQRVINLLYWYPDVYY